ncbi:tail fiber domain-containing protein [Enterobacter hormaechei subsp. xiangfangensis]
MIYTTGTIAISGNTLTGAGTNFTAAGSLIRNGCTVIAMTSPAQVFQITAIGGATSLTVTPAASPAIPAGTKYSILLSDSLSVDGLAQDIAETFTMYQRYMSGFADVMTGTGNVTITINGTAVTVPAQKSLAQKDASGGVPVSQGGTGSTTAAGARSSLGVPGLNSSNEFSGPQTFNDVIKIKPSTNGNAHVWFYDSDGAKSRGVIFASPSSTGRISIRPDSTSDGYACSFDSNGKFTCATLSQTSDERLKSDITQVTGALYKLTQLRGLTYRLRVTQDTWVHGAGVLAQELEKVLPCAVATSGEGVDSEGGIIQDTKSVDYSALSALYVEAFKEVSSRLICLENEIKNLRGGTASPEAAMTEAEAAKKDAENLDQADNPNNQ